ncbi:hypothetical protein BaRGS_00017847 [Batillaria attramentaria]|uniref:Uncharacterized protein n=1 Tax=Batillaria attramentaria TaxID=370345 RepID=A0ABD0KW19_9CAEN
MPSSEHAKDNVSDNAKDNVFRTCQGCRLQNMPRIMFQTMPRITSSDHTKGNVFRTYHNWGQRFQAMPRITSSEHTEDDVILKLTPYLCEEPGPARVPDFGQVVCVQPASLQSALPVLLEQCRYQWF